jgi:hypothetical protein
MRQAIENKGYLNLAESLTVPFGTIYAMKSTD